VVPAYSGVSKPLLATKSHTSEGNITFQACRFHTQVGVLVGPTLPKIAKAHFKQVKCPCACREDPHGEQSCSCDHWVKVSRWVFQLRGETSGT
jgi:hypothetical protein